MSVLAAGAALACTTTPATEPIPAHTGRSPLEQLARLSSLEKRNEPVIRFTLLGKVYYLAQSPCCDIPHSLFDEHGSFVCAPTGGFAGQGDGKCPELRKALTQAKGEQVPNPFYKP